MNLNIWPPHMDKWTLYFWNTAIILLLQKSDSRRILGCPWLHRHMITKTRIFPAAAAASLQLCPTLCDPIDGSPPGFPSLGFSRQEHWSGLPFPSPLHESESEVAQSCPTLVTPWTAAYQAPLSMGFSRQNYWSGVPLPSQQGLILATF